MAVKKAQEIWETTTEGTTFLNVRDPRNPEGWTQRRVGGKGTKRITMSAEEREFNQELVPFENQHLDPFSNGLLIQVTPGYIPDQANHRTNDELIAVLTLADDAAFEAAITIVTAEVILRRLGELAEKHAPMMRHQFIRDLIEDRYAVGKTSRVVREIENDDEQYADL